MQNSCFNVVIVGIGRDCRNLVRVGKESREEKHKLLQVTKSPNL